jgi:glycosyltransferase involved in cell wall biosynthesis
MVYLPARQCSKDLLLETPGAERRMRIAMIVFNTAGEGTYWRAYHLGRVAAKAGHEVALMATSPRNRWRVAESQSDRMTLVETPDALWGPLRSGWDPWNTLRRIGWMKARRFDLVHAFEARPTVIFPALAVCRRGAKLVIDWADLFGKGGSVEERPEILRRLLLRPVETYFETHYRRSADAQTAINRALAARAQGLAAPGTKVLHLPNGCDASLPMLERAAARMQLGIAAEARLVGIVGGLFDRDARLMAEAWSHLAARDPDALLVLAGNSGRHILRHARGLPRIEQLGRMSAERLHAHASACDVLWLPLCASEANRGRMPLKVNNYLTTGRPTVTTDVGEAAELISQLRAGVVAQAEPRALAEATLALLDDEALKAELGGNARRAAVGELAWERRGAELIALYQQVAG